MVHRFSLAIALAAALGGTAAACDTSRAAAPAAAESRPAPAPPLSASAAAETLPAGCLRVVPDAEEDELAGPRLFPLEHTDVAAEIAGNVARVEVTQKFRNPYDRKIEAVYVFPLPHRAAVDEMEIRIGDRTVKGVIKKREEARRIYEAARETGHVAALLDQERPNIFTQFVANILPGNRVVVRIRYFETVPYEDGRFTFSFPMVVGPRFIPGAPTGPRGPRGGAPPTTEVPDAARITPPVLPPSERSGHDIALSVRLDAGAPLAELASPSHRIEVDDEEDGTARIRLAPDETIPNKDFVLRYRLDGDGPRAALLPHRTEGDGYFLFVLQPEAAPPAERVAPKEMIFVVDGSGSMHGFPIEKVKEAMRYALANLAPGDTFQIVRFSNRAETFAPVPVAATPENVARGLAYVESLSGRGGTILLEGVRAALSYPDDPERLRIVSFMTDGYIGNEAQILAYLDAHLGRARLFSFGVGSSVNRYLLDKMAEIGRGAVEYVLLGDDARAPVERFYERVRSPYLTDIEIDWGGLAVEDIYPKRIPDLFVGQPVVLHGRYARPGRGTVTIRGRLGGEPYERRVAIALPEREPGGAAVATLWARARIEELATAEAIDPRPERVEAIVRLALDHRLVTAYTSFVAVEERIVTGSDEPLLVEVPVPMPEGVSYEGVFGEPAQRRLAAARGRGGIAPGIVGADELARPAAPKVQAPGEARTVVENGLASRRDAPEAAAAAAPLVRLEAARSTYRAGEPIEIVVVVENATGRPLALPAALDVRDGRVRFQILDADWRVLPHPAATAAPAPTPATTTIPPGARARLRVVLNPPGGYRLDRPGTYHVVLLGAAMGLPDSSSLTLRIE